MGVFSRFKDIVNSNINSILDKAEDPEKMLKMMMQEMEDTLIELKSSCAAKMAQAVRMNRKYNETVALVERWQQRAELAVKNNRDDLAREALIEKKNTASTLDSLKKDIESIEELIAESKKEIHLLEDKLTQSRAKLKLLQEKARHAEEERKVNENIKYSTSAKFDSLEEKIDRLNAENDLNRSAKTTDDKFKEMEANAEIENELNELKKGMK